MLQGFSVLALASLWVLTCSLYIYSPTYSQFYTLTEELMFQDPIACCKSMNIGVCASFLALSIGLLVKFFFVIKTEYMGEKEIIITFLENNYAGKYQVSYHYNVDG